MTIIEKQNNLTEHYCFSIESDNNSCLISISDMCTYRLVYWVIPFDILSSVPL